MVGEAYPKEDVGKVVGCSRGKPKSYQVDFEGHTGWNAKEENLELYMQQKEKTEMKQKDTVQQWSFKTAAGSEQIDWKAIDDSMTNVNPVALVEVEPICEISTFFATFHHSLASKADEIGMRYPESHYDYVVLKNKEEFAEVVAWAKRVKSASWPKHLRNKGTVTVTLPTI